MNEVKCVLVQALASHGHFSDALNMYEEMKQAECSVERKAIISLIVSFCILIYIICYKLFEVFDNRQILEIVVS